MEQTQQAVLTVGRVRRVAGFVVLGLGAAIWVRLAWLVGFYGSEFRREEWIRFGGMLYVGAVLGLTGCWLRYKWRAAGWAAALAVPAFFGLVYVLDKLGV